MSAVGRRGELTELDVQNVSADGNNVNGDSSDPGDNKDSISGEHFSDLEKAILKYATEMTETPVVINDNNFDVLKSHFNEKQLVELTSTIAWENYRARYNHAFGIESAHFDQAAS